MNPNAQKTQVQRMIRVRFFDRTIEERFEMGRDRGVRRLTAMGWSTLGISAKLQ